MSVGASVTTCAVQCGRSLIIDASLIIYACPSNMVDGS